MRYTALLVTLALVGCDGGSSFHGELPEGRDAGRDGGLPPDADAPPDAAAPLDARPDVLPDAAPDARPDSTPPNDAAPDALPDAAPCPPFVAPGPAGDGLPDLRLRSALILGAPPGDVALWAGDLDGDPAMPEVAVIRGGRLEVFAADGQARWRSAVLDLERVVDRADLDGDGRLELVAVARRAVFAFDGLTGAVRWALPEAPFGGDPPVAIQQARLVDLDGDGLDDLYVTDSGCGDEGTGRGVVFGFADGLDGEVIGRVEGPRLNGRCTQWHGFADLDGDGRPEVLVSDGDGLHGFDPLSGERRWCGGFEAPPNGPLPHLAAGPDGRFVFLPDAVGFVAPVVGGGCPDRLARAWSVALPGVAVGGSGVSGGALITSAYDADAGRWRVLRVAEGAVEVLVDDARLLGLLSEGRALVAPGEGAAPPVFGALQIVDLAVDPPAPLLPLPIPRARPLRAPAGLDRTPELAPLLTLGGDPIVLRSAPDDPSTADRVERLSPEGLLRGGFALAGAPGAIRALGDGLAVAEAGGAVAALDGDLTLRVAAEDGRAPVRAAAGAPRLAVVSDGQRPRPAAVIGGVAALLDPDRPEAPVRWQTAIGTPRRGGSPIAAVRPAEGADGVLVRDARAGDAAWAVLDAGDGARRWRHRLDPAQFRPVGQAVVVDGPDGAALVARADLILRPEAWAADDPSCAVTILDDPDPTAPADACPGFAVKPREVRGLDPATGACRWRLVLRPAYLCGGPSNQALSAADGDGDGRPELYLTETNAIRRIDPETGALTATADLGFHDAGALRGGGWMRGGPGGLVRLGGNGPVEAFDADLGLRWRAPNPPGLRLQAWIGRDGVVLGDRVWLSPAAAHPLMAWDLADGAEVVRLGLAEGQVAPGAPFAPEFGDVRGLVPVTDVDGAGAPGLLAVADDGVLYGLTAAGAAWVRPHDAALGGPVAAALEPRAPRSLLVPAADGRVLVYGPPGPAAPPVAWDLPCPPRPSCDAADDIDRTESLDRLCAAWVPVAGVEGYEVRVLGPNSARITPWLAAAGPPAAIDAGLVPGVRYAVEVRAVGVIDGRAQRSVGRVTDGVDVINDAPPAVVVGAQPAALTLAEQPVTVSIAARDDDRLAGWRLEVRDGGDRLVRRLGGGPLVGAEFAAGVPWNLEDADKRPVAPGVYRVVGTVVDRAGNPGVAEAAAEVCDGACR